MPPGRTHTACFRPGLGLMVRTLPPALMQLVKALGTYFVPVAGPAAIGPLPVLVLREGPPGPLAPQPEPAPSLDLTAVPLRVPWVLPAFLLIPLLPLGMSVS